MVVEQVKSAEKIKNEQVAEVLGKLTEMSRGKHGGSDENPNKKKQ